MPISEDLSELLCNYDYIGIVGKRYMFFKDAVIFSLAVSLLSVVLLYVVNRARGK